MKTSYKKHGKVRSMITNTQVQVTLCLQFAAIRAPFILLHVKKEALASFGLIFWVTSEYESHKSAIVYGELLISLH